MASGTEPVKLRRVRWPRALRLRELWQSSLPLRVLLVTLVASLVVLVLAGFVLLNRATAGVVDTKREASVVEAAGIHSFVQQQLRRPETRSGATTEQLSRLADMAGAQSSRFKMIIQGPSSILTSSGIEPESVPDELIAEVENGSGTFITPTNVIFTDATQDPVPGWVVGNVLVGGTGERFPVYYVFPMDNEIATLQVIRAAVISTGGALLVGLAAIAYLVTVIVLRPIRRASKAALRLASGNLDDRMVVRGTDDIASLAESMNEMADDLQERIRELESLSMVQRRFVSDVSHELRTPLTTIKMAADLLHEGRGTLPSEAGRAAELMSSEIDRFDAMLSDLLEISRFDAGVAVLAPDVVDFSVLVESEAERQRPLAQRQGSTIRVDVVGDDVTATVDPRRIRRVLRNLLVNAIEHGEGKDVDVTIAADKRSLSVTVRDYGVGFAPSQSVQVFERFWRADPSRNRVLGGSGLGLAISLEDARLHNGWLSAWGRPGEGAQFRLTVPRSSGDSISTSPLPLVPTDVIRSGGSS